MAYSYGQSLPPSLMGADPYQPYANAKTDGLDFGQPPVPGATPQINPFTGAFMGWTAPNGQTYVPSALTGQMQAIGPQTFGDSVNGWSPQTSGQGAAGYNQHEVSPYVKYGVLGMLGAMGGYGALAGAGVLGAEAAAAGGTGVAAGGTGTLAASSVPAATVSGTELGMLGGGGAAGVGGGVGGTAAAVTPWTQYAASGGSLLGAGGAGGASAAPAAGGAATSGLGSMSNLFGTGLGVGDIAPLIGAVGGALQGGQNQTSTQTRTGDPALAGLQQQLINQSIMAASQPFQAAPGFNADQQAAFQNIRDQQNSPLMQAGSNALIRQMQPGDNPYLQGVVDKSSADIAKQFNNTVVPNLDAMNIRANSGFGTSSAINGGQPDSLRQNAYTSLNDTTANAANNLRFGDYTAQQNRSLQAAGMVPGYNAMNTGNTQALLNVGNQQQGFANQEFMRQQQYPQQQMQLLGYPMGFSQGGSSSSTTPGVGPWAGGISGLLGGIGMGNTLGQTPPPPNPMMNQTYGSPTYPQSYPPGYTTPWGTP